MRFTCLPVGFLAFVCGFLRALSYRHSPVHHPRNSLQVPFFVALAFTVGFSKLFEASGSVLSPRTFTLRPLYFRAFRVTLFLAFLYTQPDASPLGFLVGFFLRSLYIKRGWPCAMIVQIVQFISVPHLIKPVNLGAVTEQFSILTYDFAQKRHHARHKLTTSIET